MAQVKRLKAKGRKSGGQYLALPRAVSTSDSFRNLSGSATKTLLMIATQYNGSNNGDFQATHGLAKQWGIGSEQTLSKALHELQETRLIIKSREGVFMNPGRKCSLYAVTWQAIDHCSGKLDIAATQTPPRCFSIENNKTPSTETVVTGYGNCSHREKTGI